jgi:hypothetical protein
MRILLAIVTLFAGVYAAHAFGLGKEGLIFGKLGASSKKGVVVPQPTGDVLMVDGTSLILQTDGASFICRAGGC